MEVPESIEADVSGLEMGEALRLEDLPPLEGVTFLDDPHETVIATVSAPIVEVEPEPEEGEELAEGEEAPEGEAEGAPEGAAAVRVRVRSSSVGARAPRRWTCFVVGLGNPGREHARDRHNAGWMVVDELARRHHGSFRSKFSGQFAEVRVGEPKLALLKPETYMNLSGSSLAPRRASSSSRPSRSPSTTTSTSIRGGSRCGSAAVSRPQRAPLDQAGARLGGVPPRPRRVGRPGRGDRRPVADYVLSPFARRTTPRR